ncbi:MAG TPA: DUF3109 family protein [Bacteroidales bacterium]|nr:DUF3109 family protein [Bacteroidales bacterium]
MLRIDDTIFSFDILEKRFMCNLPECLGNCCRYGDSGAPLSAVEVHTLEEIYDKVKPYLREEGTSVIESKGKSVKDFENDNVTPLINDAECAYTILENNIFKCGIEKAYEEGKTDFRKPLSCHLFPARIKYYSDFRAVNYQELQICRSAIDTGNKAEVYVYEFLRTPLIRAFGEEMYKELCIAAKELRKSRTTPRLRSGDTAR